MNIYGYIGIFIAVAISIYALLHMTFGAMLEDPDNLVDTTVGARYRAYPNYLTNPSQPVCEAWSIVDATEHPTTWQVVVHYDTDTIGVAPIGYKGDHVTTIELWGIDAPEPQQPYADAALLALQQIIPVGAAVKVYPVHNNTNRYIIGSLETAEQSVQLLMVGNGWAFTDINDPEAVNSFCLNTFEDLAREHKSGLWQYMPHGGQRPWQFREAADASTQ